MAKIEFYQQGGGLVVAVRDDGAVPRVGEFVSIQRKTWKVAAVTWAVDSPTGLPERLRANVEMTAEE